MMVINDGSGNFQVFFKIYQLNREMNGRQK